MFNLIKLIIRFQDNTARDFGNLGFLSSFETKCKICENSTFMLDRNTLIWTHSDQDA